MKTSKALLIVLSYIALMLAVTQCKPIKNNKNYSGVKMCPLEFDITLERGGSVEKDFGILREVKTSARPSEVWIPNNLLTILSERNIEVEGAIIPNSWISFTSGFEKAKVGAWQNMKFKVSIPTTAKPGFYISVIAVKFENIQETFYIPILLTVFRGISQSLDKGVSADPTFQDTPHDGELGIQYPATENTLTKRVTVWIVQHETAILIIMVAIIGVFFLSRKKREEK